MHFSGFPREGLQFLNELAVNNNKEWFEANRYRYENTILQPNQAYVEEMGEHLQILVPTIHATPKTNHSLFRIYRDARLHPAEPIKTRIGIICWQGSGHRMKSSSFYMHYDTEEIFIATGIRTFKPSLLATYREYIQDEERRRDLHGILETLKAKGYRLPETKYKRMPRGCSVSDIHSDLYLMGALYAYTTFPIDDTFHSESIIDRNFGIYEEMSELQQWVYRLTLYAH
jgi:uncharacterized protein (TIGR02453 family)